MGRDGGAGAECRLIGRLARRGTELPLTDGVTNAALGSCLVSHNVARRLLLTPQATLQVRDVYALTTDHAVGVAAMAWIRQQRSSADLAHLVFHDLVEEPLAAGRERLISALTVLSAATAALTERQARAVLRAVTVRARQPVDPYADDAIAVAARSAFIHLVAARPELDEAVIEFGHRAEVGESVAGAIASLFAAAIRRRGPDGGRAAGAAVKGWSLTGDEAVEFLRSADNLVAATSVRLREQHQHVWARRLPHLATRALVAAGGPLTGALVGAWAYHNSWQRPVGHLGADEAIGALALLATVNVFTVQLSATRLPGPVARVAAQPRSIGVAYSTAIAVLALALFEPSELRSSAAVSWAAIATATIFSIALCLALLTFARRTDPARAAAAYRRTTDTSNRIAGRYLGRLQAKAAAVRDEVPDLNGVIVTVVRERVGRRTNIIAQRRGFLLPNMRRLRRLAALPPLSTGDMVLRISAGIGTIVEEAEPLATLSPGPTTPVTERFCRRVEKALRLRRVGRVDETTSAAVGLIALSTELAEAGDFGTSRVVAQEAALLVANHVEEARWARRREFRRQVKAVKAAERRGGELLRRGVSSAAANQRERDLDLAPVVPALRATTLVTVSQWLKDDRELFDMPELVLGTLLEVSDRAEATASLIAFAIPDKPSSLTASPSDVGQLLTLAGIRAMETADNSTLAIVRERIRRLHPKDGLTGELAGVGSILTAICCWVLPTAAHQQLTWYLLLTGDKASAGQRANLMGLCRVGAAALLSGLPSIAFRVAKALANVSPDLDQVRMTVLADETRLSEETHSALRGRYLGDSPSDALASFLDFAASLESVR